MKTILIVGGAGYLGSHLTAEILTQTTHRIIVIDNYALVNARSLYQLKQAYPDRLEVFIGDKVAMLKAGTEHPEIKTADIIIDVAEYSNIYDSFSKPIQYQHENYHKSLKFYEYVKAHFPKLKKIIYKSTVLVYRKTKKTPADENYPVKTRSPYAKSKFLMENTLADLFKDTAVNVCILRSDNILGSGYPGFELPTHSTQQENYLVALETAMREKKSFIIPKKVESSQRDYLYILDLCRAYRLALEYEGAPLEIFNIASPKTYSYEEVIQNIFILTHKKIDIVYTSHPDITDDLSISSEKAKQRLSWESMISLNEILETMVKDWKI